MSVFSFPTTEHLIPNCVIFHLQVDVFMFEVTDHHWLNKRFIDLITKHSLRPVVILFSFIFRNRKKSANLVI